MSDADCTPGREPRSVAASLITNLMTLFTEQNALTPTSGLASSVHLWTPEGAD